MIDLYVYYKVRAQDAAAIAPRVRALQAALADGHRGAAQLKRRPDVQPDVTVDAQGDAVQTWMEVYPGVADTFPSELAAAAANAGIDALLAGPRRAEIFVDLTPCA
jgi:hypothetical protein